jgi:predicted dehydrogenase
MNRRSFLRHSASAALLTATPSSLETVARAAPSNRLRAGMIGADGRAGVLNRYFAANPEVEIAAIAEIDPGRLPATLEAVTRLQGSRPKTVTDFRRIIDDAALDVIVVGTPDHWHAIPTILACMNGQDVYAHNIVEGRRMIAAARRFQRVIQVGSQHRTTQRVLSAQAYIRAGHLGRCLFAKAWESARQGPIGRPADSTPPPGVDYDLWLGPAPKRPFNRNRFHKRWRWFFDYGTGDLGNDGIHRLDFAIAMMNAALEAEGRPALGLPHKISALGGKWYFDDAQEWPDTLQVSYEFNTTPPRLLTYEMRVWAPYKYHGESEGAVIYGDQGYLVMGNRGWRAYTRDNELVQETPGDSDAAPHVQNFIDCVKSRRRPACDLETVGHPASVLCHAGNIAWRTGRTLTLDPASESFPDDPEANALRGRPEWRRPYILPEV